MSGGDGRLGGEIERQEMGWTTQPGTDVNGHTADRTEMQLDGGGTERRREAH